MRCFRVLLRVKLKFKKNKVDKQKALKLYCRADTGPKIGLQLYHHNFVFKG